MQPRQDDPELLARIKRLRAAGATDAELAAFVDEHDQRSTSRDRFMTERTDLQPPPPQFPGFAPQGTAVTGRTPEEAKGAPLRFLGPGGPTVVGTLATVAGGATGAGVARPLAARLGGSLLGRVATGVGASVAGGGTSRAVATPGDVSERAAAAANPSAVATDAAFGSAIPLASAAGGVVGRYLGLFRGSAEAREISSRLADVAKQAGRSTDDVAREIEQATGRPLMVADLDRYWRALSVAAAKRSPGAERVIQDAVNARAGKAVEGAIDDIATVTGHRPVDVAERAAELQRALSAADEARFAFLGKDGGGLVTDPEVLRELRRVRKLFPEVEGLALNSARLDAAARGVAFNVKGLLENPTLQHLHAVKQALAKPEGLAEARALAGKPLGKVDLRNVRKLGARFRQQLMDAYPEYSAAVEASQADRQVIDALRQGQKATASAVSPAVAASERATAIGEAVDPARVSSGFGEGVTGQVGREVRRRATDAIPGQRPARSPLDYLGKEDVRAKLAATTDRPAATLEELRAKLGDRLATLETDYVHTSNPLEPSVVLGDERLGGGRLAGAFGEARTIGDLVSGTTPGGSVKLLTGALLSKVLQGRRRPALQAAADRVAGLLVKPVGPTAARDYREMVALLSEFNKLQGERAGRVAAGIAGARGARR
jgi:hypothetical protein